MLLFFTVGFFGCQENRLMLVNRYKYFEATIDDIPPVNRIEAIAIMDYYHPEVGQIRLLVGNQKNVEKIIGHAINPQKVVDDGKLIEKLAADFKNAKQSYIYKYKTAKDYGRGDLENAHVVFITKDSAYMIPIRDINGEFVSGPNYQSKELKKDFDALGLD
jgi:hypothetical protein